MTEETQASIHPLPVPLFAACEHIRNAVRQYVLAGYSFPGKQPMQWCPCTW